MYIYNEWVKWFNEWMGDEWIKEWNKIIDVWMNDMYINNFCEKENVKSNYQSFMFAFLCHFSKKIFF